MRHVETEAQVERVAKEERDAPGADEAFAFDEEGCVVLLASDHIEVEIRRGVGGAGGQRTAEERRHDERLGLARRAEACSRGTSVPVQTHPAMVERPQPVLKISV